MDRASDFESAGRPFESGRAHQPISNYGRSAASGEPPISTYLLGYAAGLQEADPIGIDPATLNLVGSTIDDARLDEHLRRLRIEVGDELARDPGLSALIGSYDLTPAAPNFVSQYKNLSHAFVHRSAAGEVPTFWSGFGGIRTAAFRAIGGFDETFFCYLEDVDLGWRLWARGRFFPNFPSCVELNSR